MTERLPGGRGCRVDPDSCRVQDVALAGAWLERGGVVAVPTDTFYGLAADPRSGAAVDDLFAVKGRPRSMALPLIAASFEQVEEALGSLEGDSLRLARAFWPGPLSLVVAATAAIDAAVHGGLGTVAVRVPDDRVARALAASLGFPITATSANRSGEEPAREVASLGTLVDDPRVFVIDGGVTRGGAPSTIVDAREAPPRLVRAGAVPWNRVLDFLNT